MSFLSTPLRLGILIAVLTFLGLGLLLPDDGKSRPPSLISHTALLEI